MITGVTRRTLELVLVTMALGRPVFGSMRLWGIKTMQNQTPGTFLYRTAEVVTILT